MHFVRPFPNVWKKNFDSVTETASHSQMWKQVAFLLRIFTQFLDSHAFLQAPEFSSFVFTLRAICDFPCDAISNVYQFSCGVCCCWMSGKCLYFVLSESEVAKIQFCCCTTAAFKRNKKMYAEKPTLTEIRFDPVDQFERWYALGNITFLLVRPIHTHTHTFKYTDWKKGNDVKKNYKFGQFWIASIETEPFWTDKKTEIE